MRGPFLVERVLDEGHTVLLTVRSNGGRAVTADLTPGQARELAEDLMVAAREAVPCASGCGQMADDDYCGQCLDGGAGEVRS